VVYYERTGTVEPMRVSPEAGIPTAAWLIPNVPAGAGHGQYWFRALDGPGGTEGTVGASIVDDERTTGASVGGVPGEPSTVARYVHRDHLGSTRAVTDEACLPVGTWKYCPFGAQAHATGEPGPRMKFTSADPGNQARGNRRMPHSSLPVRRGSRYATCRGARAAPATVKT